MTSGDLPDAVFERTTDGGWLVRVPLRTEEVHMDKRTVISERLAIQRPEPRVHTTPGDQDRERSVASAEDVDATQPLDATTPLRAEHGHASPHDTLAGSGMEQDPTH